MGDSVINLTALNKLILRLVFLRFGKYFRSDLFTERKYMAQFQGTLHATSAGGSIEGHRTVELKDDFYLNNDLNSQMNIKIMP